MINYIGLDEALGVIFPYIQENLTADETAPVYETEPDGMADLGKVFELMKNDEYYVQFSDKAAYLVSSIAGSQYFSNGNKRLSVVALLCFLIANDALIAGDMDLLRSQLRIAFPSHEWEDKRSMAVPHSLFLYNLAVALGDRHKWEGRDFPGVREDVARIFASIYRLPDEPSHE